MSFQVSQHGQRNWPRALRRFATGQRGLVALVLFAAFLFWYLRLFDRALVDDAFIGLNYVKSLRGGPTWGFYPGHPANTATSPLNIILLSLISGVEGSITESPLWLAVASFAMMAVMLDRISQTLFGSRWLGWVATTAFVFNPWLVSTLGLESILLCSLLVVCLYLVTAGKWHWLAFCLGLLSIARADGLLFTVIFLLYVPRSQLRFRFVATFLGTIAPWYLFSWIYLGSFVPDSLIIRVTETSWQEAQFFTGFRQYLQRYPAATVSSFSYLVLLPSLAIRRVRNTPLIRLVLAVGLAHFLAYSLLGVPPYHWYYAPECAAVILFGMLALGALSQTVLGSRWRGGVVAAAVVMFAIPLAGMSWILVRDHFDVAEMPIHTNVATAARYAEVASELRGAVGGNAVLVEGEIGTLGYYCNCLLLDPFTDRRWLIAGVNHAASGDGISAEIYRINFLFLRPDPGFPPYSYILTVRSDALATRYAHVGMWKASTRWSPATWIVLAHMRGSADVNGNSGIAARAALEDLGARP
jgi:hypothetical protein